MGSLGPRELRRPRSKSSVRFRRLTMSLFATEFRSNARPIT